MTLTFESDSGSRAVSATIGVVLLVAVTLVLTVALYSVVGGFAGEKKSTDAGNAGLRTSEYVNDDGHAVVELTVVSSGTDLYYRVGNDAPQPLGDAGTTTKLVEGIDYTSDQRITILSDEEVIQTLETGQGSAEDGANSDPTADFSASSTSVTAGETVNFDASASSDPDGDSLIYGWDFGDGNTSTGETTSHSYASDGTYEVTLTVDDGYGGTDTATTTITVGNDDPVADAGADQTVNVSETVQFDGSGSSDPDGHDLTYDWDFADGTSGSGATPTHSYDSTGTYAVDLTVDDGYGGTDSDIVNITVEQSTQVIGETGSVSVSEDLGSGTWKTINFKNSYSNPVIIAKPISYDGSHPSHIRVSSVSGSSADITVEEWVYLDGDHATVTVSYMVVEAGTYSLPDGTLVEVGTVDTDHSFTSTGFSQSFGTTPVVFTQSQTYNGGDPIVTRNEKVSTSGFDTKVQEEEARGSHTTETVGYIALEPNAGTNDGRAYEVGSTSNSVTHQWYTINFAQSYGSDRNAVLDMQTEDGGNTAGLRYDNFNSGSIDTFVEEEQSSDSETDHTDEVVGYWVFDSDGDIIAEK